ncbi:ATP/GTP-binding protein [Micromonospora sp. NPDC048999]|uniref:GTP-binding protein n=1 Tax=Micromonospora sp. NPDC048999 TaxID=3155391 RepID=UPI0033D1503F
MTVLPAAAHPPAPRSRPGPGLSSLKIVLTGPFGVGKTTLVGAVSEIAPVTTEARLSAAAVEDTTHVPAKTTTTVAMDFGRLSVDGVTVYVYGMPGQDRFWFMWDALTLGAAGVIVVADTRRLADSFRHVDYVEHARLPFVVAVNQFPGARTYPVADLREALALGPEVPIVDIDARDRDCVRRLLIALIEHTLRTRSGILAPHTAAVDQHDPTFQPKEHP